MPCAPQDVPDEAPADDAAEPPPDRPVRPDEANVHAGAPHDLRGEALHVVDTVPVRGNDRPCEARRVGPVVEEDEAVAHGSLGAVRGPVEHAAVEGERRRSTAVETHRPDRTEAHHLERELPAAQAPARPASPVGDDEDDAAVGELADRRPGLARREHALGEVLAVAGDRPPVADEDRSASDRVRDIRPEPPDPNPERERPSRTRLANGDPAPAAARLEDSSAARYHGAATPAKADGADPEVPVDERRRQAGENDVEPPAGRRPPSVAGGEERGAGTEEPSVELPHPVPGEPVHLPAAEGAPAADAERPVEGDAEGGARGPGPAGEHAVAHEHPARPPRAEAEVVAVDAGDGRHRREPPLHRRHPLAPEHRPVAQHRLHVVEAERPGRRDDVRDERPAVRPADLLLVGDARHERDPLHPRFRRRRKSEGGDQGEHYRSSEHRP
jgi:hypothetical protein